ncbi:hypothetical protein [Alicyclobacillus ferrooxydans]|uniref:Uncharacterized protein n=1 Tax=Alicyclobacillus ferrooxydans TaxID=471514 RepID=A0A0P9CB32_9BACL|nr:hypothetical protein [Alicyclobacillus ferrooxydans]KPV42671.1 hypothetical protein AN477_16190 [Alicyclobacillus ferrooxydans]
MSNQFYYEVGAFPVFLDEESGRWNVQTSTCSLGGCDICEEFETQEDAHSRAAQLAATKHELDRHACEDCYQEYVKDCW